MSGPSVLALGRRLARPRLRLASSRLAFSSAPLLVAHALEALVALARNIVLAHLISPHDLGLALFLVVLSSLVEMLTDFGLPIYAVRKTIDLPEPVVMATLQSLALLRSLVIAVAFVALAPLAGRHFGSAYGFGVYASLGLIALARGCENLGVKAMMRDFRYLPEALTIIVGQIAGLSATLLVALATHSFGCVLWGLAVSALCTLLCSHLLSPTPYRLGWNGTAARDASRFGRPLLANGLAVALSVSDRIFIGAFLSPSALAHYTMTMGTAQSPRWFAVKFLTGAFVPAFARCQRSLERASELFEAWVWLVSAISLGYGLCLMAVGRDVLGLLFGGIYAPSQTFMSLTALFIAISFLLHTPVPPSYADGDTKVVMYGSVFYALAIVPALGALILTKSLVVFMVTMVGSNTIGLLVLLRIFLRRARYAPGSLWAATALPYLILSVLGVVALAVPDQSRARWYVVCASAFAIACIVYAPKLLKIMRLRGLFADAPTAEREGA